VNLLQRLELDQVNMSKIERRMRLAMTGQCATIGAGIESNAVNGAESSLRLPIDYAGIANRPLFDLALFDLFGYGGIVRNPAKRAVALASTSKQRRIRSSCYDDGPCASRAGPG
jgi:hypothetical protein